MRIHFNVCYRILIIERKTSFNTRSGRGKPQKAFNFLGRPKRLRIFWGRKAPLESQARRADFGQNPPLLPELEKCKRRFGRSGSHDPVFLIRFTSCRFRQESQNARHSLADKCLQSSARLLGLEIAEVGRGGRSGRVRSQQRDDSQVARGGSSNNSESRQLLSVNSSTVTTIVAPHRKRSIRGKPRRLTATVSSSGGTVSVGTVQFYDGDDGSWAAPSTYRTGRQQTRQPRFPLVRTSSVRFTAAVAVSRAVPQI